MVIEHTFITTMDAPEAMRAATEMLRSRGFESAAGAAFPVGSVEWDSLEMRRGKSNPARAKNVAELPQGVRLHWDRGRVSVAISITASAEWGLGGHATVASERPAKMRLHQELLTAIAVSLEQRLAQRQEPATAMAEWERVEAMIRDAARRRS